MPEQSDHFSKAILILHSLNNSKSTSSGAGQSADILKQTAARIGQGTAAPSGTSSGSAHSFQVQYNPASISFQANAEEVPFQSLQKNVDDGIPSQNFRPPSVVMSFDLIFDDVNNQDAFMFEKMRISAGDVVSSISGALKSKKGGYTVQPQTNGLVALVLRQATQTVTFRWADLSFTGKVTEVSARYTMFSVSGKPIRSVIRLNIFQQVDGKADMQYWDKAFDRCFGDSASANSVDSKGTAESFGNLLNIGF